MTCHLHIFEIETSCHICYSLFSYSLILFITHEFLRYFSQQSSGCRFDKKPLYRYSGCHSYDLSALNVILGIVNDFNEKSYAAEDSERFFRKYTPLDEENVSSSGLEEMTSKHSNDSTPTAKLSFHKMGWRIQA